MAKISNHITTEIPSHDLSFDVEAFDEAIRSQGVKLVHYRSMRCPVGMVDINDNQRPHPDHEGCSNSFIYTKVGCVTALFTGNSKHKNQTDMGFQDGSTVQSSFPRFYDGTEENGTPVRVSLAPFDRLYLDEPSITVPTWELYLHHESGRDRLKFPVACVEELIDSRGNRYYQDVDFKVSEGGQLIWGSNRPVPEMNMGPGTGVTRGAVCSVRYRYRPYYYVGQLIHEIRITQYQHPLLGTRTMQQMPQSAVIHREFVGLDKQKDENEIVHEVDAHALRQVLGPINGGYGPR